MTEREAIVEAAKGGQAARVLELAPLVDEYGRRDAMRVAAECDHLGVVRALATSGVSLDYVLHEAVRENAVQVTRWLLGERPADVKAEGLFAEACATATPAFLEELLAKGAPIDDRSGGWSGAMLAVRAKRLDVLDWLLARGASPRGLILAAAEEGDLALAKRALALGDDVDYAADGGNTALMNAAAHGHDAFVRWLLDGEPVAAKKPKRPAAKQAATKKPAKPAKAKPWAKLELADTEERTAISHAAASGHVAIVKLLAERGAELDPAMPHVATIELARFLIDEGAKVDTRDLYGETALHAAASRGNLALVELLLEEGAKPDVENINSRTPIIGAARAGHLAVCERLLDAGAKLSTPSESYSDSPIDEAIEGGHVEIVRLFLASGALDADVKRPPLHKAASMGNVSLVDVLLDAGANIDEDTGSYDRDTALRLAAGRGHLAVVERLLERGATELAPPNDEVDEYTAIRRAAKEGHVAVVELLAARGFGAARGIGLVVGAAESDDPAVLAHAIELDPAVDAPGYYDYRALHRATARGRIDNVRLLLDRGADVNLVDKDGKTAHRIAIDGYQHDIARLLEERGARREAKELVALARAGDEAGVRALLAQPINVDVKGELDRTAVHEAAEYGHLPIVELLATHGAKLAHADEDGWTPLMEAAEMGHVAIVALLLDRGVPPFGKDRTGQSAYDLAVGAAQHEVVALLEGRDADRDPREAFDATIDADDAGEVTRLGPLVDLESTETRYYRAIDRAAREGKPAAFAALLALGAKPDATTLSYAVESGRFEIVEAALAAGIAPTAELLSDAIRRDDHVMIECLLAHGAPLGGAHVVTAIEAGNLDVAHALIERGAAVDAALGAACSKGDADLIAELLERGAKVDLDDYDVREAAPGWLEAGRRLVFVDATRAVIRAANDQHAMLLAAALAAGGDPNGTDEERPLADAVAMDRPEMVEALIAAGAAVDITTYGQPVAAYAAKEGRIEQMLMLIERGATAAKSLVTLAARSPEHALAHLDLLLARGAALDETDDHGLTPIINAARKGDAALLGALRDRGQPTVGLLAEAGDSGNRELVEALLAHAELEEPDKHGYTVAMNAARGGHTKLFTWLLDRGAVVTNCAYAAASGNLATLKVALARGAVVDAVDPLGRTALVVAAQDGDGKMIELLLAKGAKIDHQDTDGDTALITAARGGNGAAVKALLKAKANRTLRNKEGKSAAASVSDYDRDTKQLLGVS